MELYGVFGIGGFGREVMPIAKASLKDKLGKYELVFIDEAVDDGAEKQVNGYRALSLNDFINSSCETKRFNVAVGDYQSRKKIAEQLVGSGVSPFDIVAASSISLDQNEIAEGAIFCPYSTVTSNAKIGKFFHANLYSYVAHDCVIGDYVTFAPNVHCNGSVIVEDYAYIGTGAVIKQGIEKRPVVIGEGAVVGMGAVVNKSVEAYTVVAGNPAKKIRSIK